MRYLRLVTCFTIMFVFLGLAVAGAARAELRGNSYVDTAHHVSFGRPNESWKIFEIPGPGTAEIGRSQALAAFSNGDGQAIAVLAHCPIDPTHAIASAADLKRRWPSLAGEVIAIVSTGESSPIIEDSTWQLTGDAVTLEIHFRSAAPGSGEFLENWVTGFLVRDTADQQHIYAIRCAAPQDAFNAWESDFSRIMSTLQFEGPRRSPVFIPVSTLRYWLFFGAVCFALGLVLVAFRSHKRGRGVRESSRSLLHMEAAAKVQRDLTNVPDRILGQDDPLSEAERPGWENNPPLASDQPLVPFDLESPADHVPDSVAYASATPAADAPVVAVKPEAGKGFWKCACGRINPAADSFCARCNADRVATAAQ